MYLHDSWRRALVAVVVCLGLALTLGWGTVLAQEQAAIAAPSAQMAQPDLEQYLGPDGRIDIEAIRASGYSGPLDVRGLEDRLPLSRDARPTGASRALGTLAANDEYWSDEFAPPGVNGTIYAVAVYKGDLIVGGSFSLAGGVPASNIARWDGVEWHALGAGTNSVVYALVVKDDNLFVGGSFNSGGGVGAACVASWNGTAWSSVGAFPGTYVLALAVYNGQLVAGGSYRVARWNGSLWETLGSVSGGNARVWGLVVDGDNLFAGGQFTAINETTANNIARWDGSNWNRLGTGVNDEVYALTAFDGEIVVGGAFSQAGGSTANFLARWDGINWSRFESQVGNGAVRALTVFGSTLVAGGQFWYTGGITTAFIAYWNGTSWSSLGSGMNNYVYAFGAYGGNLVAGGDFTHASGTFSNRIATWNGISWSAIGTSKGLDASIHALSQQGDHLYTAGVFTGAGGAAGQTNRVARMTSGQWNLIGTGMNEAVHALAVQGASIVAGGTFGNAGGATASKVAHWDGSAWSQLGTGVPNGVVWAVAVYKGDTIVAGSFTQAGSTPVRRIARWDGSAWHPLGSGTEGTGNTIYALLPYGEDLFVGGSFTEAGGLPSRGVARWDGTQWHAMPDVAGTVAALGLHGGTIFAGGAFTTAGGVPARNIARWNGTGWDSLGHGLNNQALALTSCGGRLYAGGEFTQAGWNAASNLASWDGATWSPLGSGTDGAVRALANDGQHIYAGGDFVMAGGKPSSYFARWDALLGPCAVTVTRPTGSESICGGEPVQIQWTFTGACGSNVRIELLREGSVCQVIAASTEGDGAYTWPAAQCAGQSSGYSIRVTDLTSEVSSTSAGSFSILPGPSLAVTYPNGNESLVASAMAQLTWDHSACCGPKVKLELLREGSPCQVIADSAANNGSFSWRVSQCAQSTEGYRLRVTDLDTGTMDVSDADFQIGPAYRIISIADVANDQGRQVRVRWYHQRFDTLGSDTTITAYTVWRRIDANLIACAPQAIGHGSGPQLYPPGDWDFIKRVPANGEATYSTICETLCDNTASGGPCNSTFFVRAETANPLLFFDTLPNSGYSLDNLAPAPPANLRLQAPALLAWDESEDPDFKYFSVYGSSKAYLDSTAVPLCDTIGTGANVSGARYDYYHVTATDFSGNRGEAASLINTTAVGDADRAGARPTQVELRLGGANPIRERAAIVFGLPRDAFVRLAVMDVTGRVVATLRSGFEPAGMHTAVWAGREESGTAAASGIYFLRIEAAGEVRTKKVVLTK